MKRGQLLAAQSYDTTMISKRFFLFVSVCLLSTAVHLHAQGLPDNFQRLLRQNLLRFALPPGFEATPVIDNGDVRYDYAIKSNNTKLEIRYRIWPITNGDAEYGAMAVTMGLNISNGQMMETRHYPVPDVTTEFGADEGCSGMVQNDSEFGKGYKFCIISVVQKHRVANAFTFFLFDDPRIVMDAIVNDAVYHALRFE
jgi:hypothetical protein